MSFYRDMKMLYYSDKELNVKGTAVANSKLILMEEPGSTIVVDNNRIYVADIDATVRNEHNHTFYLK
ncbi:hypothetical protein [Chryseobacterium cheonjiense]|uniref:Uncharacterized protein n=1 Tax=Chryseobacterium cheonjiense TaxID=2728845 RepID=A0A7Y0A533_9FLAO|nr:hypothetical protein [Chryseobacterium cheonjiense]NML56698.1 hypothetical protein [Chryseobacterium cheonjiense]